MTNLVLLIADQFQQRPLEDPALDAALAARTHRLLQELGMPWPPLETAFAHTGGH